MKEVTAKGQTVEEAVNSALAQLQTSREQVDIEVIDEGKRGLLGIFGNRSAIVNVKIKADPIKEAKLFLLDVMDKMGIQASIQTVQEGRIVEFKISGDKLGLMIGKRGQTLNSLQYLTQLAANRHAEHFLTFILNPEGYRERREATLKQLAERLADKAIYTKTAVRLEPMPSFERKIIHTVLAENEQIETISEGEEPHRYLVIKPR